MDGSRQGMLAKPLYTLHYLVTGLLKGIDSLKWLFSLQRLLPKSVALVIVIQSLNGCEINSPTAVPKFTQAPQLLTIDGPVPLAALVTLEADQPVLASYRITDGRDSWQAHTRLSGATQSHNIAAQTNSNHFKLYADRAYRDILLKFKPDTEHRIYVRITNAAGQTTEYAKPLLFHTPALPEGFPKINVDRVTPKRVTDQIPSAEQDDIALISLINNQSAPDAILHNQGIAGWLIALDGNSAEVVWYMPADAQWHRLEQLQSGNLRLYSPAGSVLDVDMLGNKLAGWVAEEDTEFASYQAQHVFPSISDRNGITNPVTITGSQRAGSKARSQKDQYHSWVDLPNQHRLALSIKDANLITEFDPLGDIHQQWDLMDILDQSALRVKQQKQYPLQVQQPVRMNALNKGAYQSLLLSYQLPIESGLSSHLMRLSFNNLIHSQDAPVRPKISLGLDSALIYDNKLVSRLIPPDFSESDHRKLSLASQSDKKGSGPSRDKILAARQSKLQISDEIPIAEGDWQIVLDSPQGTVKQTLKIDKQQGLIGLGYLDNYPVMVVINGNRLHFKARTTGTQGTATWRYTGTIDDSGFVAQGELNIRDDQNQALAANIPWQAYRE